MICSCGDGGKMQFSADSMIYDLDPSKFSAAMWVRTATLPAEQTRKLDLPSSVMQRYEHAPRSIEFSAQEVESLTLPEDGYFVIGEAMYIPRRGTDNCYINVDDERRRHATLKNSFLVGGAVAVSGLILTIAYTFYLYKRWKQLSPPSTKSMTKAA